MPESLKCKVAVLAGARLLLCNSGVEGRGQLDNGQAHRPVATLFPVQDAGARTQACTIRATATAPAVVVWSPSRASSAQHALTLAGQPGR